MTGRRGAYRCRDCGAPATYKVTEYTKVGPKMGETSYYVCDSHDPSGGTLTGNLLAVSTQPL